MNPEGAEFEPEVEVAPPEDGQPEIPETPEAEPRRESVENVQELLDNWAVMYEEAEGGEKQELAYKIIRLGEALSASGLSANSVKIQESESGVLGFYVPASGEISITPEGLSLPPEHFKDVLVHEATHAGITTGREVADEGLTQIITERKVSGAMSGIYESEQAEAQEGFKGVGIEQVIDTYDFQKPNELLDLYLKTEWEDAWKNEWEKKLSEVDLSTPEARREQLDGPLKEWLDRLEQALEDSAPRLLGKAEDNGFDFNSEHEKFFALAIGMPEDQAK